MVVGFYIGDVEKEYKRIKKLKPKTITKIKEVSFMFPYKYFNVEDTEGNILEIAEWEKD